MKFNSNRILIWTPRILSILFALFISLFAMDVFGENHGFWNILLALTMHLIPTFIIIIILIISWKWEWVGGVVYTILALFYLSTIFSRPQHWTAYLFISGPLFLLGGLFIYNWFSKKKKLTE